MAASLSRRLTLPLGVVAAVATVGVAQTSAGEDLSRSLGLSARDSGFVELSFADAGTLPKHIPAGRSRVAARFVLGNREERTATYRWTLTAVDDATGERRRLDAGAVRLAPGVTETVAPRASVSCSSARLRIAVDLERPAQSIGYWTRCRRDRKAGR